jgi:hypothetical protein
MTKPNPDPLAYVDAFERFAEHLRGAVAVLTADGWTPDQARDLVLHAIRHGGPRP